MVVVKRPTQRLDLDVDEAAARPSQWRGVSVEQETRLASRTYNTVNAPLLSRHHRPGGGGCERLEIGSGCSRIGDALGPRLPIALA